MLKEGRVLWNGCSGDDGAYSLLQAERQSAWHKALRQHQRPLTLVDIVWNYKNPGHHV